MADAVAVDIQIAAKAFDAVQRRRVQHLAPVVAAGVVPGQRLGDAVVHAEVQIAHHDDGGLQPVRQVQGFGGEVEALLGGGGEQQHMAGVPVGGVGGAEQVALLGAGGHAGGGAGALNVEQHRGEFREVGEAEKLRHQGDAGAAGGGEGPRSVPGGTDDDADGGKLVLRLDDGELVALALPVRAQPVGVALEGFGHGSGGRDGIPGAHRGAAVQGAQGGGGVAIDEDPVPIDLRAPHLVFNGAVQVIQGVAAAQLQGVDVGPDEVVLALVLLGHHAGDDLELDVQQGGESAQIDDVLEQRALLQVRELGQQQGGNGHADLADVAAPKRRRQGLGVVVKEIAAGLQGGDVLRVGLGVHGHHDVHPFAAA